MPATQGSRRVEIWRKLKRYGALALPSSGYLLPHSPENQERLEWLAAAIRKYKGRASVIQVQSIDDLPSEQLRAMLVDARSRDYEALMKELKKCLSGAGGSSGQLARYRKRFQEIVAIDFFHSPLRGRVEALLARADNQFSPEPPAAGRAARGGKQYANRIWITRPRPGIDRVSSAWLIRRFIDAKARFAFAENPKASPEAVPFDMFQGGGFGHRGEDCTFQTLQKEFAIRDARVSAVAQIIHDADLGDQKFGREEGIGLERVLIGWAQQGVGDEELLERGMQLIEGLYHSLRAERAP